jgi:hypothetical protein
VSTLAIDAPFYQATQARMCKWSAVCVQQRCKAQAICCASVLRPLFLFQRRRLGSSNWAATGSLSSAIGQLSGLTELTLSVTPSGIWRLPTNIGLLTNLERLYVIYNKFRSNLNCFLHQEEREAPLFPPRLADSLSSPRCMNMS